MEIIANIIGFAAMAISILSFQQHTRSKILLFQIVSTLLFVIQFLMLGGITGMALNAVACVRTVIYYFREEKTWAGKPFWPYLFMLISVGVTFLTWEGVMSLLPMIGLITTSVSTWIRKPLFIRLLNLPSSVSWIVYNALVNSYAGICTEIFAIISVAIGLLRFDILQNEKNPFYRARMKREVK